MKSVNRPLHLFCLLLILAFALSALAGCTKQSGVKPAEPGTTAAGTTIAAEPQKGETLTVLKQLKISNGNFSYDYDYDYDFDAKELVVTAKGVPAGDQVPKDCFTWFMTPGILSGENVEALPDVSGAYEELTLWAQPLLASGRIMNYKVVLYEEDATSPSATLSYKFTKNNKGQVANCVVKYAYPTEEDYDWDAVIKYRYNDEGYLRKVSEVSEDRDYLWEFNRDENNRLTASSCQVITRDDESMDSWLSTTKYFYDDEGVLLRKSTNGEGAQFDDYTTKYLFSETTGNLSMLEDQFTRVTFAYDDSLKKLIQIKTKDLDGGSSYYSMDFTYEEVDV